MNLGVLLGYARPYRVSLIFCLSLMLLGTATALAVPWLGGLFASSVLSQEHADISLILHAGKLLLLGHELDKGGYTPGFSRIVSP